MPGRVDVGGEVTAKNIMIATGSVPFVPPGPKSKILLLVRLQLYISLLIAKNRFKALVCLLVGVV